MDCPATIISLSPLDTAHPDAGAGGIGCRIAIPAEMTVVMQHWYDKLEVTEEGFSVTLNFGDAPETDVYPL